MAFYLLDDAKRIAKKLKRIAEDEFIPDARLNWFQKAVAEGLGFRHFHDMLTSLPGEATWEGRACADYLASNGFLSEEDALQAVEWLEDEAAPLLQGARPRPRRMRRTGLSSGRAQFTPSPFSFWLAAGAAG